MGALKEQAENLQERMEIGAPLQKKAPETPAATGSADELRKRLRERLELREKMEAQFEAIQSDDELILDYCDAQEGLAKDRERLEGQKRVLEQIRGGELFLSPEKTESEISAIEESMTDMSAIIAGLMVKYPRLNEIAARRLSLRSDVGKLKSQLEQSPLPKKDLAGAKSVFNGVLERALNLSVEGQPRAVVVRADSKGKDTFSWRKLGGSKEDHFTAGPLVGHDPFLGDFYQALIDLRWQIRDQEAEIREKRRKTAEPFLVTQRDGAKLRTIPHHQFPQLIKGEISGEYWLPVFGKRFRDGKVINESHFFGDVFLTAEPLGDGTGTKIRFLGVRYREETEGRDTGLCRMIFKKRTDEDEEEPKWEEVVYTIRGGDISSVSHSLLRGSLGRELSRAEKSQERFRRRDKFVSWQNLEMPITWADLKGGVKGIWPFSVSDWAGLDKKKRRVTGRLVSDGETVCAEFPDEGDPRERFGVAFLPAPGKRFEISQIKDVSILHAFANRNELFEVHWRCELLAQKHKADGAKETIAAFLALKGDGTVEPKDGTIVVYGPWFTGRGEKRLRHTIGFAVRRKGGKITFLEGATAFSEKIMEEVMGKSLPLGDLPGRARAFLRDAWKRLQDVEPGQEQYLPSHLEPKPANGEDQPAEAKSSVKAKKK